MKFKKSIYFYESNEFPKCKLCNHDLVFKEKSVYNENVKVLKRGHYRKTKEIIYIIEKCSVCENLSKKQQAVAFFPEEITKQILKRFEETKEKFLTNNYFRKEYWIKNGYTEEEAKKKISEIQKNNFLHKKNFKTKTKQQYLNEGYTEKEFRFVKPWPSMIEYWLKKGYNEEEAKLKITEFQSIQAKKREWVEDRYPNQIKFWLKKGYTEEEAKLKVKNNQTKFSLKICKEKYGEEKGREIFDIRNKQWLKSLNKNFVENGDGRSIQSQWAFEIISNICKKLNIEYPKKEKYMQDVKRKRAYAYDFCYNKKIIELNGVYWHAHPEYCKENKIIKGKTPEQIYTYDKEKIDFAISRGYEIIVIWEHDYKNNKEEIINKCIAFLKHEKFKKIY